MTTDPYHIERPEIHAAADPDWLEQDVVCLHCGADITEYHPHTGLLPTESINGREATHSWLVCELRQEIARLKARPEARLETP